MAGARTRAVEGIIGLLKRERVRRCKYRRRAMARADVPDCIVRFNNPGNSTVVAMILAANDSLSNPHEIHAGLAGGWLCLPVVI